MGGKSKSVTVGYRYKMGLHFAISRTAWDRLIAIRAGGRDAWIGNQIESGQIYINAPQLFGGDKKEGGVQGYADVMMGEPSQGVNDYLVSKIAGLMPAFRNMFTLVFRGGLIASINPYIKPWILEGTRIQAGWGSGACWYPEKAEVPRVGYETFPSGTLIALNSEGWLYKNVSRADTTDYSTADKSAWDEGPTPFCGKDGGEKPGAPTLHTFWGAPHTRMWVARTITGPAGRPYNIRIPSTIDDTCGGIYWNGVLLFSQPDGDSLHTEINTAIPGTMVTGNDELVVQGVDRTVVSHPGPGEEQYLDIEVTFPSWSPSAPDMNPAHIIYQLISDPDLEMGYPTADIDETSFTDSADTFFAEGLGLTLSWNRQTKIKDFLQIVLDHAGAALYADPFTGKFVLKAIRGDYDPDDLDVYDEDSIVAVEDFQRPGLGETVNQIIVSFRDRINHVDAVTPPDQDLASIQAQGSVIGERREYPGLSHMAIAKRIAARDRRAAAARLAKIKIRMNRALWRGAPAGVIKVSWAKLGLSGVIFRVLSINTGTLESGEISVELVEDVFGLPASSYTAQQSSGWEEPDLEPLPIVFEEAYELPYWDLARNLSSTDLAAVDDNAGYAAATAARENGLQLSYELSARIAPTDYVDAGVGAFAPSVLLSEAVTRDALTFTYSAPLDLDQVELPCRALVGTGRLAEWVEVTAIDTGSALLTVNRGVLDTTPQEFDVGARLFFLAEDNFAFDPTERATADEVDVKLTANSGMGSSALTDATEMQVIPDQRFARPYAPGNVLINGLAFPEALTTSLTITWSHRDRIAQTVDYVTQDEGDIGPEDGVTYSAYLYNDDTNVLVASTSGVTGTTWSPAPSGAFNARLELESSRGGTGSAPSLELTDAGDMSLFYLGFMQFDDLYVGAAIRYSTSSQRTFYRDDLGLSGGDYSGDGYCSGMVQNDTHYFTAGTTFVSMFNDGVIVKTLKTDAAASGTAYNLFDDGDPMGLVIDSGGFLWAAARYGDTDDPSKPVRGVHRIDPSTVTITDSVTIADPAGIVGITTDGSYVWAYSVAGRVYRINTVTKAIDQTIPGVPAMLAVDLREYLWHLSGAVYLLANDRLVKLDAASGAVLWNVDAATGALGNLQPGTGSMLELDGVPIHMSLQGGDFVLIGVNVADGSLLWSTPPIGTTVDIDACGIAGFIGTDRIAIGVVETGGGPGGTTRVYSFSAGGGLASWQRQIRTFAFASDLSRITEDSAPRITEDGDSRILE